VGIIIDQMPKCHCELAGEGVEYILRPLCYKEQRAIMRML
jgi:hypothetical protein